MGSKESEGQAEGFVRGTGLEKLKSIVFIALGDVDFFAVFTLKPMLALVAAAKVVVLLGELAVMPLADMADMVAVLTQQARVGLLPGGGEHIETLATVT